MKLSKVRKILWAAAGLAAVAFVFGVLWVDYAADKQRRENPAFLAEFELTDHEGAIRTEEDFTSQWMLVFFGFANCPDVCPTTLAEVAVVMDGLGTDADQVQPLFISIDPERDTPEQLAEFVAAFDAGIVGLSGTPEQTAKTAKSFFVFYEEVAEAAAPDGYTMSHSSQLLLFAPGSGYVTAYQYRTPADEILADLRERIRA